MIIYRFTYYTILYFTLHYRIYLYNLYNLYIYVYVHHPYQYPYLPQMSQEQAVTPIGTGIAPERVSSLAGASAVWIGFMSEDGIVMIHPGI